MTQQPEFGTVLVIREELFIWVAARDVPLTVTTPLPLALMPLDSIFRQHALEALKECGRASTIVAVSDSIADLQVTVYAGLAVSVFPICALTSNLRRLGHAEALPVLPKLDIMPRRRTASAMGDAADHLALYITGRVRGVSK